MKKIKYVFMLLSTFLLISCSSNVVYSEHQKIKNDYSWKSSDIIEFSSPIEDINSEYQIFFDFRHIYGFQFSAVSLKVEIISPSNKILTKEFIINVYENNAYKSDCAGDYCDLQTLLWDNFKFQEKGTYKFKIKHQMDNDPLPMVMEVGLVIKKISK